ncbi:MAG: TIGR03960 family B12-binding radical SAM protein [Chloroflexi bacterium]|nr:TIGR03960 family B12-binding radical SAM protein [Chloroflexota bacterium]
MNLESLLCRVSRPARYTGNEWNAIQKDWESAELRIALAYPDVYEIGMSNMALPILYDLFNRRPGFLAERVFAPWPDMEGEMRAAGIALFSLESKRPLRQFDIIGFSLGYELTYTNVLNMLDLGGIPVLAADRSHADPIVIAGGSCCLNPEPMSDFIDAFVIGEGEEVALEVMEAVVDLKREARSEERGARSGNRGDVLRRLARTPGVYVPRFYEVGYGEDGTVAEIRPDPGLPATISRRIVSQLPLPVTRPVVPYLQATHDRAAIEIQRGCTRGCRFCQAGVIYRPNRERPHEEVLAAVDQLLKNTGYDELSLVSLSTSDYTGIDKLVEALNTRYAGTKLTISLPSLRMDNFSVKLADSLKNRKRAGLTFAPEAGSERLRQVINKNLNEEELLQTVETACASGWTNLKLYFMLGLPTETDEDVSAITELVRRIRRAGGNTPLRVRVGASTFIPKAHTPFQWVGQDSIESLQHKCDLLKFGLRKTGVHVSWQDPLVSELEAALARGDRRLGKVILRAWELGARFDAWTEHFGYERWRAAFEEGGLSPDFYAHRQRSWDEVLPWSHIDAGVSPAFLQRESKRAINSRSTTDCRQGPCNACGLQASEQCKPKFERAPGAAYK